MKQYWKCYWISAIISIWKYFQYNIWKQCKIKCWKQFEAIWNSALLHRSNHSSSLLSTFHFPWFQLPKVNLSPCSHETVNRIFAEITSLIAQSVKNWPAMQEILVRFLGWEDPLKKEMATHSSILAWRSPWTEEPVKLYSTVSQESDTT